MLLAALPWTYWLALPLLAGTAVVLIGFTLVYLKKVVEPHMLYLDVQAAARTMPELTGTGGQRAAGARRVEQRMSPAATARAMSSAGAR